MERTIRRAGLAVALAALLVATLAVPAPVAAQSAENETDPPDELFDTEDEGTFDVIRGLLGGIRERVSLALGGIGDDTSAETLADDAADAFNERSGDFQDYANSRTNASADYDVLAITFTQDGDEAVRYVVADVNTTAEDYENVSMVAATDRSVDEECTLSGAAARNADAEIKRFHDRFVKGNESLSKQYMSRMASKYGDPIGDQDVSCTFMDEGDF